MIRHERKEEKSMFAYNCLWHNFQKSIRRQVRKLLSLGKRSQRGGSGKTKGKQRKEIENRRGILYNSSAPRGKAFEHERLPPVQKEELFMKKLPLIFALVLLLSLFSAAAEGVNPYQETPVENAGQETLVYTGVDFGEGASLLRIKGASDSIFTKQGEAHFLDRTRTLYPHAEMRKNRRGSADF